MVEDDPGTRETVRVWLTQAGFQVLSASDGPQGLQSYLTERPDLVVLDLRLPGMDGLEVCRRIRQQSAVPIIMLSAQGESSDRILGLELGADDYLGKPFDPKELIARVRAQIRGRGLSQSVHHRKMTVVDYGELQLDLDRHVARLKSEELNLTRTEFGILHLLVSNQGSAFSRERILRHLWGDEIRGDERTVDSHVRNLRGKLRELGFVKGLVESVWGVGYRVPRLD